MVLPPALRGRRLYAEELKRFPRDSDERENSLPQLTKGNRIDRLRYYPHLAKDRAAGRAWA